MAKKCSISGKNRQTGNRVSHAKNRTPHVFHPNIQIKRFAVPGETDASGKPKTVRIKVSTRMIRTIDKLGLSGALRKHGLSLDELKA
jgi:large subunit ribosomal protein L28